LQSILCKPDRSSSAVDGIQANLIRVLMEMDLHHLFDLMEILPDKDGMNILIFYQNTSFLINSCAILLSQRQQALAASFAVKK
jgi:hypothetical protein